MPEARLQRTREAYLPKGKWTVFSKRCVDCQREFITRAQEDTLCTGCMIEHVTDLSQFSVNT